MITVRRVAAASAAAALLMLGAGALPADAAPPTVPTDVGELVGATFDPGTNLLWLAGGEADDGTLIGLSEDGQRSEISFGSDLVSIQALAMHEGLLYVGDIGDAGRERDFVVVYRLAGTQPGRQSYNAFDFEFPDGPQHATALMVSGRGRIYIVTDGDDPGIYSSSLEPSRTSVNKLTRSADAPAGVTDGAFLEDGSTMALRTAVGIEVIDAFSWETQATETLLGAPDDEVLAALPGDWLLVGTAAGLRQSQVPDGDVTTTVSESEPEPDPEPEPGESEAEPESSPSPTATATQAHAEDSAGPARGGTLTAVVLAGIVALGAGISTLLVRD